MNQFIESLVDCQLCCKTITVELQQLYESQLQNNNNKKANTFRVMPQSGQSK